MATSTTVSNPNSQTLEAGVGRRHGLHVPNSQTAGDLSSPLRRSLE
ncbi:hypothetical protein L915_03160 [Phytophthora nicotianae]|uniref:Uncharacterized protein n=1 Tax=Phytophthora nicotianae TaxID=4792 RepID=W2HEK7_PHYNI|nr:hypothetical protein L915_03160 [Phytophthora nicotianae]ETL47090.1 hypothetical protein L916_03127 [Phytophthora nicotianae]